MNWPAHPDDEWVEVTMYGSTGRQYVRGMSGAESEVNLAREKYVHDQITIEEFEDVLDRVLSPPALLHSAP